MAAKTWVKLVIAGDPLLVEPISDFLVGMFAAGVETGAKDEANYGVVTAYLGQADMAEEEIAGIVALVEEHLRYLAGLFALPVPTLRREVVAEEDWGSSWKEHFRPFTIVPGLVIAPTWEVFRPEAGEAVITMDPGMAFGTGHHATTCLCLELLQKTLGEMGQVRVLDVGTGTGILGMAAIHFGAASAVGIDNDPEAVRVALDNVRQNNLTARMTVSGTAVTALVEDFPVVIANIVHDVLLAMADALVRATQIGGVLIVSGILAGEQVANLTTVFAGRALQLLQVVERGEWAAMRWRRPR
jgi:ribosomal protein L11 methyltransferase